MDNDNVYWNKFYQDKKNDKRLSVPSQFCVFSINEIEANTVVEFGAGNGRDSLFFHKCGYRVIALDASATAMDILSEDSSSNDLLFQRFEVGLDSLDNLPVIDGPKAAYARFFLHALTNDKIESFFKILNGFMREGESVFLEFRVAEDELRSKVFSDHYRNYVDMGFFEDMVAKYGFKREYGVQGIGFAKFKDDDAYVTRQILRRLNA